MRLWPDQTDALEIPAGIRRRLQRSSDVRALWYLHVRELLGRALDASDAPAVDDDEGRDGDDDDRLLDDDDDDDDDDDRDEDRARHAEREVTERQLRMIGAAEMARADRLEIMHELAALDRDLERQLDAAGPEPERWAEHAREATEKVAAWLGIDAKPPASWRWLSERRRGPDRAPRRQRESAPKPPRPTKEDKADARADRRIKRVVALLRGRSPDGMSGSAIRKALKMGDGEARAAIRAAVNANDVEMRGSRDNPRYYARPGLHEKRAPKRSRLQR